MRRPTRLLVIRGSMHSFAPLLLTCHPLCGHVMERRGSPGHDDKGGAKDAVPGHLAGPAHGPPHATATPGGVYVRHATDAPPRCRQGCAASKSSWRPPPACRGVPPGSSARLRAARGVEPSRHMGTDPHIAAADAGPEILDRPTQIAIAAVMPVRPIARHQPPRFAARPPHAPAGRPRGHLRSGRRIRARRGSGCRGQSCPDILFFRHCPARARRLQGPGAVGACHVSHTSSYHLRAKVGIQSVSMSIPYVTIGMNTLW